MNALGWSLLASIQSATGRNFTFNEGLEALFNAVGIARGALNDRLVSYVRAFVPTIDNYPAAMEYLLANQSGAGSILPTLALDFGGFETLDSRITFTRASIGTRVNSRGLIETKQANEPRLDYDPATLQPRGLLVEEARTNLCDYSAIFNLGGWSSSGIVTFDVGQVAPDGGVMRKVCAAATLSGHYIEFVATQDATVQTCFSFYAKFVDASDPTIRVRIYDWLNVSNSVLVGINLQTGTISTPASAVGVGSNPVASIEPFNNGIYRIRLSGIPGNSVGGTVRYRIALRDESTYQGDGASGIFAWGVQIENATFPTSYIPTSGATVLRAADAPNILGASLSWFSGSAGSFLTQFTSYGHIPVAASAFPRAFELAEGTPNNRIAIAATNSSTPGPQALYPYLSVRSGGVETAGLYAYANAGVLPGTAQKAAAAYEVNNYTFVEGLRTPQTSGAGALPVGIDRMSIGNGNASGGLNALNGAVKSVVYFPTRLADARLQALTA